MTIETTDVMMLDVVENESDCMLTLVTQDIERKQVITCMISKRSLCSKSEWLHLWGNVG